MIDIKDNLKKIIKYRLSYSGTKETDILYKKMILDKIEIFNNEELLLLSDIFKEISDTDLYDLLTNKLETPTKYQGLIAKITNE
jgi:succinate dehydrogenase flavin-adding protein (antitoxin of CptAB toxin-antitoxin module)